MDSSDASNVHHTGRSYNIYFLDGQKFRGKSENSGCQCNHRTEYSDAPDISLNDVSFIDCAHGDSLRRRQECYEFRRFLEPHDGAMDSSDASMSTSLDWMKLEYTFFGWTRIRRNQRNSADASATTVQNIPDSPDISLNDVSLLP
jgi:hypothetical protein